MRPSWTDANFPVDSVARGTCHGQVISVARASLSEVVGAILSVLPLDEFVDAPVRRMAVDVTPDELPAVQQELPAVIDTVSRKPWPLGVLARFSFYDAARGRHATVLTGEPRFY